MAVSDADLPHGALGTALVGVILAVMVPYSILYSEWGFTVGVLGLLVVLVLGYGVIHSE